VDACTLCDSSEYKGLTQHRPDCARVTETGVIVAEMAGTNPRTTDLDGLTVCRFCAIAENATRRLAAPNSHEFSCLWRRSRALYPDGARPNA